MILRQQIFQLNSQLAEERAKNKQMDVLCQ